MASGFEVEVTISSAKDLKNVNWRHGDLKPYAVVWVDPNDKCTTHVAEYGDDSPTWDQTLTIPLRGPVEDSTLFIDIVHVKPNEDVKPLIGSVKLPLREVLDDVGLGAPSDRKLKLKRPSGRPHGKLEVKVTVRPPRYQAPDPYRAPAYGYGVPPPQTRDFGAPQQYNYPYAPPPQPQYYQSSGVPQAAGYGYNQPSYDQGQYGGGGGGYGYGYGSSEKPKEKGSKFGVGTGLAVGAVAGLVGGIALVEGAEYVEDKIADDAAEKVEEDYGDDDYGDDN